MILVSKTYEVITPESAENGDVADSGFEFEDKPMSFRQLIDELRDYTETSDSDPSPNRIGNLWVTSYGSQDKDGSYTNCSLHFSWRNKPESVKYWKKALKAAGLLR